MKVKDPNEETDDACGCEEKLAEMQAMIDELKDKVDALTPAPSKHKDIRQPQLGVTTRLGPFLFLANC
jgi:hypothetical protein